MPDSPNRPGNGHLPERLPVSLLLELFGHVPVCLALFAPDGTCLAASASLAGWLEQPADSLTGRKVDAIWSGEFGRLQKTRLLDALRGTSETTVEEFPTPQGRRCVRVVRIPWREHGDLRGVFVLFEEQSSLIGRAETVGRLALGVAHDFNNALTLVMGQVDLLEYSLTSGEDVASALASLRLALDHACQVPQQLLRFVRGCKDGTQLVDLDALIRSLEGLLRPRLGCNIDLRIESAGGAWIEGDPTQLTQVLLNLTLNAVQAMPEGGELTLRTQHLGSVVRLTVADTGRGMPAAVRLRLFEPLFSTRSGGNGLGLYMAREIVRRHGGRLSCESELGRGTVFTLDLPAQRESRPNTSDDVTTVLVIESDPDIRQLTGMILSQNGYRTLLCGDVAEARDESSCLDSIRLVLLDAELCATCDDQEMHDLLDSIPDARLLFLSTGRVVPSRQYGSRGVIAKPFRAERLLLAVESALEE